MPKSSKRPSGRSAAPRESTVSEWARPRGSCRTSTWTAIDGRPPRLIVLCHKFRRRGFVSIDLARHVQRDTVAMRPTLRRQRVVAIELGRCRSVRSGGGESAQPRFGLHVSLYGHGSTPSLMIACGRYGMCVRSASILTFRRPHFGRALPSSRAVATLARLPHSDRRTVRRHDRVLPLPRQNSGNTHEAVNDR